MIEELYDEKGRKLASGTIVPDGGRIKVPLVMIDAAPPDIAAVTRAAMVDADRPQAAMHRPGFASVSMADRAIREQTFANDATNPAGICFEKRIKHLFVGGEGHGCDEI